MAQNKASFWTERVGHLAALEAQGQRAWPDSFETTWPNLGDLPEVPGETASVAGRVVAKRAFGRLIFLTLQDITGRLQVMVRRGGIPEDDFVLAKATVRVGDHVGVRGTTLFTQTGEFTLDASHVAHLGIALRAPPEKFHGLQDRETRYRQRYLDIVANPEARELFLARSRLISAMRGVFERSGFLEVETPVLATQRAGALARPFTAHHHAYDLDVVLRIAPETWLKRVTAAGVNRCYEFARCFRNEGISPDHLQEFTMLEFYVAYWSYRENMAFTQRLLAEALRAAFGRTNFDITGSDGTVVEVDFSDRWRTIDFRDAILRHSDVDIDRCPTADDVKSACARCGVTLDEADLLTDNRGRLLDALYKKVARPHLTKPVFLTGHPIETSPLARRSDEDPRRADRFQIVMNGVEICNAYSELVDPIDQRARLERQAAHGARGDDEAMEVDFDFLRCMEHGMPPISGCGIGIDRLIKIVLGLGNIRDAVLFPLLRPAPDDSL